jgi:hypothetical protein
MVEVSYFAQSATNGEEIQVTMQLIIKKFPDSLSKFRLTGNGISCRSDIVGG